MAVITKTFAIGDIHGMRKQLVELVDLCLKNLGDYEQAKFVFVGDYIDRGPDSKGVIDFLLDLKTKHECVFLQGNHEDMFLRDYSNFLYNGGFATLKSYGWSEESGESPLIAVERIPEEHLEFFENTELYHDDGLRIFVHAGINRQYPNMEDQGRSTLLWVRQPFLQDPRKDGGYIVHGHTPQENGMDPMEKPNRVNIDTGAVFGGRLTAAVFSRGVIEPIQYIQVACYKEGPIGE